MRRRAAEVAYDPDCIVFLKIPYDEYVFKGAKTTVSVTFEGPKNLEAAGPVPLRGREFVPRRIYTKIGDLEKHGFTNGCKGCTRIRKQLETRVGHSEECRDRIEQEIPKDIGDERSRKAKEHIDHYIAQRVEEGEDRSAGQDNDPQGSERVPAAQDEVGAQGSVPQQFDIGSPDKGDRMEGTEDLDDGPTLVRKRRLRTPVRAPPAKRKNEIHDGEPGTKRIIIGDE